MDKLQDILERAAIRAPDKGFIVVNNSQKDIFVSYSELLDRANRIAYILKHYYLVSMGDEVMISVEKSEDFIFLFWGSVLAGGIPVLMPSVQASNKHCLVDMC